jgi:hypothetical protein
VTNSYCSLLHPMVALTRYFVHSKNHIAYSMFEPLSKVLTNSSELGSNFLGSVADKLVS